MSAPAGPALLRRRPSLAAKRLFDVVVSAIALVLGAPVLAMLAVAVKLDSPGPVLFRQTRVGRFDQPFTMHKFRSMAVGSDEQGVVTGLDDPRVTRVGRVLRTTSLDELPQLWNILRGDMSLVGPRPLLPGTVRPDEARRHWMRPGLTGLPAVFGRQTIAWDERIALDLRYVEEWSLALDAKVLAKTLVVVLSRRGVYDADGEMKARTEPDPTETSSV